MAFTFKDFSVDDGQCAMKVGTDGVLLGAWVDVHGAGYAVDAGAGCGLLALMLAATRGVGHVTAVEVDAAAADDCQQNVANAGLANCIDVLNCDIADFKPSLPVDLLISNPPFHSETLHSPSAARAGARHADGALTPQTLLTMASLWLSPTGSMAMITPAGNDDAIIFSAIKHRLYPSRICHVSAKAGQKPMRVLWQFTRIDGQCQKSLLAIRTPDNDYSSQYINLTKDFYLHLKA